MQLQTFIDNFRGLRPNLEASLPAIIETHLKPAEEITKERISAGVNTENQPITYNKPRKSPLNASGAYTNQYAKKRAKKGRQSEVVDLQYTGSYVNQIKAERDGKAIVIESQDAGQTKAQALNENYPNHMGLSETQQAEVLENITKEIGERSIQILIGK